MSGAAARTGKEKYKSSKKEGKNRNTQGTEKTVPKKRGAIDYKDQEGLRRRCKIEKVFIGSSSRGPI